MFTLHKVLFKEIVGMQESGGKLRLDADSI